MRREGACQLWQLSYYLKRTPITQPDNSQIILSQATPLMVSFATQQTREASEIGNVVQVRLQ